MVDRNSPPSVARVQPPMEVPNGNRKLGTRCRRGDSISRRSLLIEKSSRLSRSASASLCVKANSLIAALGARGGMTQSSLIFRLVFFGGILRVAPSSLSAWRRITLNPAMSCFAHHQTGGMTSGLSCVGAALLPEQERKGFKVPHLGQVWRRCRSNATEDDAPPGQEGRRRPPYLGSISALHWIELNEIGRTLTKNLTTGRAPTRQKTQDHCFGTGKLFGASWASSPEK
jgi:hypothetical protein